MERKCAGEEKRQKLIGIPIGSCLFICFLGYLLIFSPFLILLLPSSIDIHFLFPFEDSPRCPLFHQLPSTPLAFQGLSWLLEHLFFFLTISSFFLEGLMFGLSLKSLIFIILEDFIGEKIQPPYTNFFFFALDFGTGR